MTIDFKALSAKFPLSQLSWRVGESGEKRAGGVWCKLYVYLTRDVVMDRLDEVCGPDGWKVEYAPWFSDSQLCGLSIRDSDGNWVTKWDGAPCGTNSAEGSGPDIKGGLTRSFRRVTEAWGIGRYLSSVGDIFGNVSEGGSRYGKTRNGTSFKWDVPRDLPESVFGLDTSSPVSRPSSMQSPLVAERPAVVSGQPPSWRDAVVHFGNLRGKSLGELNPKQLEWFQNDWLTNQERRGVGHDNKELYDAILLSMPERVVTTARDEIPF